MPQEPEVWASVSKGFLFFILDEDATFAYAHAALSLVSI